MRDLLARLEASEVDFAVDNPLDALGRYVDDFVTAHGVRPTAAEAHHDGFLPRSGRSSHGSWLDFVADRVGLAPPQAGALAEHRALLQALETTEMTRSYKMLVLEALLDRDELPGGLEVGELAAEVARIARRSPVLASELRSELDDRAALEQLLVRNPIAAWTGGRGTGGVVYFGYENGRFATRFTAATPEEREGLQQLVRELVDWRLAEYLDRRWPDAGGGAFTCKVSHAGGRPILFLPDRAEHPQIPEGLAPVVVDGAPYEAIFAKVAVNVVRRAGEEENVLPEILRGWFGASAGAPGTSRQVTFRLREGGWRLEPVGPRRGRAERWHRYARQEIPGLFGFEFNPGSWNAGFVALPGHLFLLVTLDKSGHAEGFQYQDRFVAPDVFQWQSQNRTRRESRHGQLIRDHEKSDVRVHLFVRGRKRGDGGGAAPFVYCGEVRFVEWEGDAPITVRWRLGEGVPEGVVGEWGLGG